MSSSVIAYVGLGGNMGEVADTLRQATLALDALPSTHVKAVSSMYRTPAWGMEQQPDFINGVAALETTLDAQELLHALLRVELQFGRDRDAGLRWGPRTLDLDLLLYGDRIVNVPGLCVPHAHLHERAFALVPLLQIAPDILIPGLGSARDALSRLKSPEIEWLG